MKKSERIAELGDWRGETLSRMRKLIKEADPDVVEEWKWMGSTAHVPLRIDCPTIPRDRDAIVDERETRAPVTSR